MSRASLKTCIVPAVFLICVIGISVNFKLHSTFKNLVNRIIPIDHARLVLFYNQRPRDRQIRKYRQFADDANIQKELTKRLKSATEKKVSDRSPLRERGSQWVYIFCQCRLLSPLPCTISLFYCSSTNYGYHLDPSMNYFIIL